MPQEYFWQPQCPKSESPLRNLFSHREELHITFKTCQQLNLRMVVFHAIIVYLMENSYWSQLFSFTGKKTPSQHKWISGFQSSERVLGVVEIANFENLATQDTLWVSSFLFFFLNNDANSPDPSERVLLWISMKSSGEQVVIWNTIYVTMSKFSDRVASSNVRILW